MGCVCKKNSIERSDKASTNFNTRGASTDNHDESSQFAQVNRTNNDISIDKKTVPFFQNKELIENEIISSTEETNTNIEMIKRPKPTCKIENKNLISENDTRLEENYKIIKFLGKGAFGTVHKVLHKATMMFRAMKTIKKSYVNIQDDEQRFLKEIEILKLSNHPNIIKIIEYFTDSINYYLILEYLPKGDLGINIDCTEHFSEAMAASVLYQVFSAASYMHSQKIVHRDIKPENILVCEFSEDNPNDIKVKLSDFGTCNFVSEGEALRRRVGSPYFIAPEILNKSYDEKCDIWSCGVLMYFILVGTMPFQGRNIDEIKAKILIGNYDNKSSCFLSISNEGRDLIKKLLHYDYKTRISAETALQHPWFSKFKENEPINEDRLEKVRENMQEFKLKDKLQLASIAFIIHFIDLNDEMIKLVEVFQSLDKNGDGRLSMEELIGGLKIVRGNFMSEVELISIFERLDQDKNGFIEYEEFLRVCIDRNDILSDKNLKLAFDNFDRDKDNLLKSNDIKMILGTEDNEYVNDIISRIDQNNDGEINFEEFASLMKTIINYRTSKSLKKAKTSIESNMLSKVFNKTVAANRFSYRSSKSSTSRDVIQVSSPKKDSLFKKE